MDISFPREWREGYAPGAELAELTTAKAASPILKSVCMLHTVVDMAYKRNFVKGKVERATLDQKILYFQDIEHLHRFEVARAMLSISHSNYAILMVLFAYFETIAQCLTGETTLRSEETPQVAAALKAGGYIPKKATPTGSRKLFLKGFRFVYPNSPLSDQLIEEIYGAVRCGLYHSGEVSGISYRIGTHDSMGTGGFVYNQHQNHRSLDINPRKLLDELESHLDMYIAQILDPKEVKLRAKFEENKPGIMGWELY